MKIIFILGILAILTKFFKEAKKSLEQDRLRAEMEEQQSDINYYKVLPHKVRELQVLQTEHNKYRLKFTPISIKQMDEALFSIGVKAKMDDGHIAFDLILNTDAQKMMAPSSEIPNFNMVILDTNQGDSDGLLKVLSNLFNVEIGYNSHIVRSVALVTEKFDINIENIWKPRQFTAYFADNKSSIISPALDFFMNIEKGEIIIQEVDTLFRPIIINKLLFKPNRDYSK